MDGISQDRRVVEQIDWIARARAMGPTIAAPCR